MAFLGSLVATNARDFEQTVNVSIVFACVDHINRWINHFKHSSLRIKDQLSTAKDTRVNSRSMLILQQLRKLSPKGLKK